MPILAFDIGIKNLAWCCADNENGKLCVKGWANENLITGGTAEGDSIQEKCQSCSHNAAFWYQPTTKGYCSRHCPPLTPALRDLSGTLIRKLPVFGQLKLIAQKSGADKKEMKSKSLCLDFLMKKFCFPKPPKQKVKQFDLEGIHDGIRAMIVKNKSLFMTCTEILLENQPVLKNPVMKSVQMMLYASLRDLLHNGCASPKVRLVHAKRKTEGATKGDEGYAERKGASESRVLEGLSSKKIILEGKTSSWFSDQTKKSDLADCLSMCADALGLLQEKKAMKDAKELEE